jgi:hypothetical protein
LLGNNSNDPNLIRLTEVLRQLHTTRKTYERSTFYRPNISQAKDISRDLKYLLTNILPQDKLRAFVESNLSSIDVQSQLLATQEMIHTFVEKMEAKYAFYEDALHPVYMNLYRIKFGLRLLRSDDHINDYSFETLLLPFIEYFQPPPKFNDLDTSLAKLDSYIEGLSSGYETSTALLKFKTRFILARKVSSWLLLGDDRQNENIRRYHALLSQMSDIWLDWEERRRQLDLKKLQQYFTKTSETEDGEIDDKELFETFPDFNEELDMNDNSSPDRTSGGKAEDSWQLDLLLAFEVHLMHFGAFGMLSPVSKNAIEKSLGKSFVDSFDMAGQLISDEVETANTPESTVFTASLFLCMLRGSSANPPSWSLNEDTVYDFYKDPNVSEAAKIQSLLAKLDRQVAIYLDQFPENSMLQQISLVSRRISSFAISSSLMKFLSGLELLHRKCDEWESLCSREYSLKAYASEITSTIVQWRQLELHSWNDLLKAEERNLVKESSRLWFHLFRIVSQYLNELTVEVNTSVNTKMFCHQVLAHIQFTRKCNGRILWNQSSNSALDRI